MQKRRNQRHKLSPSTNVSKGKVLHTHARMYIYIILPGDTGLTW